MSLQKAKDSRHSGLSWELKVAAQECQKLFLQELEGHLRASLHHLHLCQHHLRQQLVDDTLGIREKEQQVQIHQYPYQVHNMRFQAQVRKIHQYPNQIQKKKM